MTHRSSRRKFLQAGVLAKPMAWLSASSNQRVLGSNDRVRVGFVGLGLIGKRHLLDFKAQPDVEIVCVSDVYPPRLAEGVQAAGGKANAFVDFRKILDRKDVDAVVLSTPDHWHALGTILACHAGKDVYVEKPLTHVVREGQWMIDTARYYGRVVQVGTQQRSGQQYRKCLELLRAGHIGDVQSVRISACRNILPGFSSIVGQQSLGEENWNLWLGPAPFVPFDPRRCLYHFRWFWDYSGGQTTNLLSHDIDIVQWVTQQFPKTVTAMGGRRTLKGIGETPDLFEAIYEFPGFLLTWSNRETASRFLGGVRSGLEFVGTSGTLIVNRSGLEVYPDHVMPADAQIPRFDETRHMTQEASTLRTTAFKMDGFEQIRDQFQPHVRNFLDCVKSRQAPVSDLEGGHRTATSCHLANIAMKVGRVLHWNSEKEELEGNVEASRLLTKQYRTPWDRELQAVLSSAGSPTPS